MNLIALDTSKRCSRCKERKATTEFVKDSSRKDKLTNNCKSCEMLRRKKYYCTHKEERCQSNSLYISNRRKTDPLFKLIYTLRKSCGKAKSKFGIKTKTAILLGCSWAEAQAHLIQTAILKYGSYSEAPNVYHIDHKLPLSKATNVEEMVKRCHISNLRYLTPADNMAKGARLDWEGDLCS